MKLTVKRIDRSDKGYVYRASIGTDTYVTDVSDEYYLMLTGGNASVDEFVKASFEFLLEREGPESILRHFDIRQINTYFPEYESEMRKHFKILS